MRGEVWKRSKSEKSQTPRLRAPVGTPGETGVGRPDGRKPEACEGAGPGSGGVTGNSVARRAWKRDTRDTWTWERCWVVNGVCMTYMARGNAVTRVTWGARWSSDILDVGVNGQRKTRVEAVYICVGEWHVAHIVVRGSKKLLIRVLLPWVRGDSHTMRGVCWW